MFELAMRLAIACLLGLGLVAPTWADLMVRGRVITVSGGDGITLVDAQHGEHRMRLAFIDAPALGQPFGDEAQSALAAMVLNREVTAKLHGVDVQGNAQAEIVEPKGHLVNLELVKRGLVWHDAFDTQAAPERDQYQAALREAQQDRRGMWALDRVEPPRDHRARVEQFMRRWFYVVAFCAALAALAGIFAIFEKRIAVWLAEQDALEITHRRASAGEDRCGSCGGERQRIRDIANQELDRLPAERRRAKQVEIGSKSNP
ncbi:endonuclease YncB(thermonuclease family) [Pelomonas aquatica]|uniref:Endonuclease YncB(Thermonuclease family) n=1 Tax=Pelomonas aquatica TaxID=431058 RepID=A0ABU1ZFY9_9BURK|nr:thermonuclease family protein [Pelomonas aquatica]MDR7299503.1 endonuclease YncB(thermonuclease family) [Pelomonas aquatica]